MEITRVKLNDLQYEDIYTRDIIQTTIIHGLTFFRKNFHQNPSLKELIHLRNKLVKKVNNQFPLGIPFYGTYAAIRQKYMKNKIELLNDLIKMHQYAYGMPLSSESYYFDKNGDFNELSKNDMCTVGYPLHDLKKEMTVGDLFERQINLHALLDTKFTTKYGTYLLNLWSKDINNQKNYSEEEYLKFNQLSIEQKRENKLKTR